MKYAPGTRVRVAERTHDGHHRTPSYLKGRCGTIARVHAAFPNPETRAYGGDGLPQQQLYLVAFDEIDVSAEPARPHARVYADIFEHWLEGAE